ncbi:arylamine N-acetyltransferase family protein [Cupriavidus sp. Marseille-Q8015]|nr:MAG: arylamine N-acetyltransferase [Cupriavidus sp.]
MTADPAVLTPDQRDAWLARIGAEAPAAPTRAALDALMAAQQAHIPFENLDPLVGRPVRIDLPSILDKLVARRRGGYCFEQNTLFAAGLRALGYHVVPLAARVRWKVPDDVPTGLTHMLLRVEIDHEAYIADVGFGGANMPRALALSHPADAASTHRLVPDAAAGSGAFHALALELRVADSWRTLYRFDLTPQQTIDYVARNWYVCTYPESAFVQTLKGARMVDGTRYTLANRDFTIRAADGTVQQQVLTTTAQILDTLAGPIGIALDDSLRQALAARLPAVLP